MKTILTLLTATVLLTGCFSEQSDDALLEQDRKNLEKSLDGYKVLFYKFGKICLRSSVVQDSSAEFQEFQAKFRAVSELIMKSASQNEKSMSVMDYIKLYRDYKSMKSFIVRTDEDQYPV